MLILLMRISDHKTDDFPLQITILKIIYASIRRLNAYMYLRHDLLAGVLISVNAWQ